MMAPAFSGLRNRAGNAAGVPLSAFLTRRIWLWILPLVLLAGYLAIESVRSKQAERDLAAAHLAQHVAAQIDHSLNGSLQALQMLAGSPLVDDASRWQDLYALAQGFHRNFGNHVIFADVDRRLLFNTRVPFGTVLPALPRPQERAGAPSALDTGAPSVGDRIFDPVAKAPLVAIAVPVVRHGKTAFVLVTTFETDQLQEPLNEVALPAGWALTLRDGKDEVLARRTPAGQTAARDVDGAGRFVVASALSPWSVVLDIPRSAYRAPLLSAAALLAAILCASAVTGLGAMLTGRRLGSALAALTALPGLRTPTPEIREVAAVHRLLNDMAHTHEAAVAAQRDSEERINRLVHDQKAILDSAIVSFVKVKDRQYVWANEAFTRLFGYTQDEVIGQSTRFLYADDQAYLAFAAAAYPVIRRGEIFRGEVRYLRKDGTALWCDVCGEGLYPGTNESIWATIDITQRKRVDAALRASEERLRLALDAVSDGLWDWDVRTGVVYRSPRYYELIGRKPDEGPSDFALFKATVHPDDLPGVLATIDAHKLGKTPAIEFDYRLANASEEVTWLRARGRAVERDAGGAPLRIVGTLSDITASKRAEEALRASEQRFRLALRNAPVSVAIQDRDLRYIWAYNQRTARPEEIIGHVDADLFGAEQAQVIEAAKRRVLDEGVEIHEQMWLDRPGGRIFLDIYWEPVHDADGQVTGVGSATVDLTPMQLAKVALQASEAKFRVAFANAAIGLAMMTPGGHYVEVNPAYCLITGYTGDELRKLGIPKLIHPDDLAANMGLIERMLAGEITDFVVENRYFRKDGAVVWVRKSVSCVGSVHRLIREGILPAEQAMYSAPWEVPVAALSTEAVRIGVRNIVARRPANFDVLQDVKTLRLPGI